MTMHTDKQSGKVTCTHDAVELGPRPDRETCIDCGSSWPPGTITGGRTEEARIRELTELRLAEIGAAQAASRKAEVDRRVADELAKQAAAAKAEAKSAK